MNDLEKRRNLLQILYKIRDLYGKLHVVSQWLKVHDECWAVKIIQSSCRKAVSQMKHLGSVLVAQNSHFSTQFGTYPVSVDFVFEFLNSSITERPKAYFARSIWKLGGSADSGCVGNLELWSHSLESILRAEFSRQFISLKDCSKIAVREIAGNKLTVEVLREFVVELTLVPKLTPEDEQCSLSHSWFLLKVHSTALGEAYDNSFTTLFQSRCSLLQDSPDFMEALVALCAEYIEMYYYEKLKLQFLQIGHLYGRNICKAEVTLADSFELNLWFCDGRLTISRFASRNTGKEIRYSPTLGIDAHAAAGMLCDWFYHGFVRTRLGAHLQKLLDAKLIFGFHWISTECVEIVVYDQFVARLCFSPFSLKASVLCEQADLLYDFGNTVHQLDHDVSAAHLAKARAGFFHRTRIDPFILLRSSAASGNEVILTKKGDEKRRCVRFSFLHTGAVELKGCHLEEKYSNGILQLQLEDDVEFDKSLPSCPESFEELLSFADDWLANTHKNLLDSWFKKRMSEVGLAGRLEGDEQWILEGVSLPFSIQQLVIRRSVSNYELLIVNRVMENFAVQVDSIKVLLSCVRSIVRIFEVQQLVKLASCKFQLDAFSGNSLVMSCKLMENKTVSIALNANYQLEMASESQDLSILVPVLNTQNLNLYEWLDELQRLLLESREPGEADSAWLSDAFF